MIIIGKKEELEKLKEIIRCPYEGGECPGVICWECFDVEYNINFDIKELK